MTVLVFKNPKQEPLAHHKDLPPTHHHTNTKQHNNATHLQRKSLKERRQQQERQQQQTNMFQRKPDRKQLHQTDVNSAFFTSHKSVPAAPKSPIEVGYGENNGPYKPHAAPRTVRRRSGGSGSGCGTLVVFLGIWSCIVLGCGYYYMENVRIPQQLQRAIQLEQEKASQNGASSLQKTKAEVERLQRQLKDAQADKERAVQEAAQAANNNAAGMTNSDKLKLQGEIDSLKLQINKEKSKNQAKNQVVKSVTDLQNSIQSISKRALLEKYGAGPYRVEMELNFPVDNADQNWYFTIDLAAADDMPHTVYTFLEQVSNGLYNNGGYSFYSSADHVIVGGPRKNHLTPGDVDPESRFRESGVGSVAFPEYSNHMPHVKYTLGMSGRPGGPSFYINMIDNSNNHGPGGYAQDGTGDPCFGSITNGLDVVDRMHKNNAVGEGPWKDMNGGPVAVRSVKIL